MCVERILLPPYNVQSSRGYWIDGLVSKLETRAKHLFINPKF